MRFLNGFKNLGKILVCSFLFIIFTFYLTKEVNAAGTCTCTINQSRMWTVGDNNCDPVTEYASGCEGSGNSNPFAKCECVKKENSELPPNTCTCDGSGKTTDSSCQGETPRENCVTRSQPVYCYCSKETSNLTDDYIPPRPGTPEATMTSTTHVYNPLCDGDTGINTAFGCIPYDASGMVAKLLQILFGVAGGIAFLLMVYGFILVATSSGDEKKLQGAKETITSAITGLLISIFALFLFRLIVINILQIPLN